MSTNIPTACKKINFGIWNFLDLNLPDKMCIDRKKVHIIVKPTQNSTHRRRQISHHAPPPPKKTMGLVVFSSFSRNKISHPLSYPT